jgi:Fe-S cluster assembly iron-binding protein IscA
MLTITHDAAALLANQRAEMGAPASFGVRLSARDEADADGKTELVIAFVPAPMAGDQVTEQEGLKAFVASELTRQLDDATLDATPTNGTPPELFLRR